MGWSSAPVLNACIVREGGATAIILNLRVMNALSAANAFAYELQVATAADKEAEARRALDGLAATMGSASDDRFATATASLPREPTWWIQRIGFAYTWIQLLFVVLHEVAHLLCGHLDDRRRSRHHPLSAAGIEFFAGSRESELEADSVASRILFSLGPDAPAWEALDARKLLQLAPAAPFVPMLIMELLSWLHVLAPEHRSDYYSIPRSHPYPLERAAAVLKLAQQSGAFDESRLMRAAASVDAVRNAVLRKIHA